MTMTTPISLPATPQTQESPWEHVLHSLSQPPPWPPAASSLTKQYHPPPTHTLVLGVLSKTDMDWAQSLEGKPTVTRATTPEGEERSTQEDQGGTEGPGPSTQGERQ